MRTQPERPDSDPPFHWSEKGEKELKEEEQQQEVEVNSMAGNSRYLRYIVFAVVALILILFISSSSTNVPGKDSLTGFWKGSLASSPESSKTPSLGASDPSDDKDVKSPAAPQHTEASSIPSHENTSPNPHSGSDLSKLPKPTISGERMNATFVTLARNSDVWDISRSIRQVEDRFNRNYNYDWVFLNDAEFDDTFKKITGALTSGRARYGKIESDHWSFPTFIDQEKAKKVREDMHERKIIYGDSISYRHMCRYESGFFYRHPLMMEYEYYWRVEPSIELYCDVAYDPFKFMVDNGKKYSFVLSLYEYLETIPTLWDSVVGFMKDHPEHIAEDNSMAFLSDDGGKTYNKCHFWSNFEIGSLEWLRSKAYADYFDKLDHDGGFFYERWGDAPVHSIAAALMLPKEEIHFFNDIAYYHVPFTHCPTGEQTRVDLKCHCNPQDNFDWNGYSCTSRWFELNDIPKPEGYEKEQ